MSRTARALLKAARPARGPASTCTSASSVRGASPVAYLEVDGDDYRIRVGGIGRHILHRRNGAAYGEGLRRGWAPGHAARRVDRAADRRAPYGAARTAGPRARGGRLRDAVVQKVCGDRAALHPALPARNVR